MKTVYDFVVFCGCEIGKHNYTLRQWLWIKNQEAWNKTKKLFGLYKPELEKRAKPKLPLFYRICKVFVYCFIALFLFNLIYILLREKYGLQGCVLCDKVDKVNERIKDKTTQIFE